jgi:hypothetical protein
LTDNQSVKTFSSARTRRVYASEVGAVGAVGAGAVVDVTVRLSVADVVRALARTVVSPGAVVGTVKVTDILPRRLVRKLLTTCPSTRIRPRALRLKPAPFATTELPDSALSTDSTIVGTAASDGEGRTPMTNARRRATIRLKGAKARRIDCSDSIAHPDHRRPIACSAFSFGPRRTSLSRHNGCDSV